MSRAFDFTTVGVTWIICVIIHRLAVELFAPDSTLYQIATIDNSNVNAAENVSIWWQWIGVYMPLTVGAGILAWAFIREYRRQVATAAPRPAPRR